MPPTIPPSDVRHVATISAVPANNITALLGQLQNAGSLSVVSPSESLSVALGAAVCEWSGGTPFTKEHVVTVPGLTIVKHVFLQAMKPSADDSFAIVASYAENHFTIYCDSPAINPANGTTVTVHWLAIGT